MNYRILIATAFLGILYSCSRAPESYPPPEQRKPIENPRPYRIARIINMNDSDVTAHFVKDIDSALQGGLWRWAKQRPTIKLTLRDTSNQKFTIDFAISDETLKETGPVTISFFVNDHPLDQVRYDKGGIKHFEKPVSAEWLKANAENTVAAGIDKMWTSKADGVQLGFLLIRMGLTQ